MSDFFAGYVRRCCDVCPDGRCKSERWFPGLLTVSWAELSRIPLPVVTFEFVRVYLRGDDCDCARRSFSGTPPGFRRHSTEFPHHLPLLGIHHCSRNRPRTTFILICFVFSTSRISRLQSIHGNHCALFVDFRKKTQENPEPTKPPTDSVVSVSSDNDLPRTDHQQQRMTTILNSARPTAPGTSPFLAEI
jgi:hypothetical protein